jgi:hypothetical protein
VDYFGAVKILSKPKVGGEVRRQFAVIRDYGRRVALRLLGVPVQAEEPEPDELPVNRPPCPCCGGHMTIVKTFAAGASPPRHLSLLRNPGDGSVNRRGQHDPMMAITTSWSAEKRAPCTRTAAIGIKFAVEMRPKPAPLSHQITRSICSDRPPAVVRTPDQITRIPIPHRPPHASPRIAPVRF